MPNELNWIGLDGKEKEKGYSPRDIWTKLSPTPIPTPSSLFSSYNIKCENDYKHITGFTLDQYKTQNKGLRSVW